MRTKVLSYDKMRQFLGQIDGENFTSSSKELKAAIKVLSAAVDRELTLRQQECVRLYFYEGLSMPEIAKRLNIGKPVVWRHLQRAKKKLSSSMLYAALASRSSDED